MIFIIIKIVYITLFMSLFGLIGYFKIFSRNRPLTLKSLFALGGLLFFFEFLLPVFLFLWSRAIQ